MIRINKNNLQLAIVLGIGTTVLFQMLIVVYEFKDICIFFIFYYRSGVLTSSLTAQGIWMVELRMIHVASTLMKSTLVLC